MKTPSRLRNNRSRRSVRVKVRRSNRNIYILLDQARRLLDTVIGGRLGFTLKKHQTNDLFDKKGYLRFVFPSKALAIQFQDAVEEFCSSAVSTMRYKLRSI
ncbi:hypothetical protein ACELLULO517_15725 [Acidisoma cellulosilytica]|uniref:Uncharacterized protein n=1 Tax=Acidisoma cellulosilyticum TaxID=2802395 RepID=A0A963Z4C9_9PROT|nr:hypothetical protein [Acidisoma cellulosilyticum]MCB8881697.1 hypothetical protein [Acidisoma cellulosilyticum]